MIIRGVMYPLTACPATEGYLGDPDGPSRPTQAFAVTLAHGESPWIDRPRAEKVGTGYVHAVVEAVHSHQCAYIRMRRGRYGPCDCGAHQAMSGLIARGRA